VKDFTWGGAPRRGLVNCVTRTHRILTLCAYIEGVKNIGQIVDVLVNAALAAANPQGWTEGENPRPNYTNKKSGAWADLAMGAATSVHSLGIFRDITPNHEEIRRQYARKVAYYARRAREAARKG
jgi:hypothetical protein